MGYKLAYIYDVVSKYAGSNGRMEFAKRIGVSKVNAKGMEDTAELLDHYKKVAGEILGKNIDELISG